MSQSASIAGLRAQVFVELTPSFENCDISDDDLRQSIDQHPSRFETWWAKVENRTNFLFWSSDKLHEEKIVSVFDPLPGNEAHAHEGAKIPKIRCARMLSC